jgi:hypothetical protein
LQPGARALPLAGITILWSTDQTRALILPLGIYGGYYTLTLGFEGNIGAEIPCITTNGLSVTESAVGSPLSVYRDDQRSPVRCSI